MATVAFLHAHPDDEAIATGGTMRLLADIGHRVVLVSATRGEVGEPVAGVLNDGESLGDRRTRELERAAEMLDVSRLAFLDYRDSGMMGERTNRLPGSFWMADVDEATARFVSVLESESVDLVVCYDPHGGYGHPDHIQVHRVGSLAARRMGDLPVLWSSMNATRIRGQIEHFESDDLTEEEVAEQRSTPDNHPFGLEEDELTHEVDVEAVLETKRAVMAVHASQISDESFFMTMSEEVFSMAFGSEFYCDPNRPRNGGPFLPDVLTVLTGSRPARSPGRLDDRA